jgi:pimeloyl-ACP methyl ester carboxylesterase
MTVPDRPYQESSAAAQLANPPKEKVAPPLGTSDPLIVEFDDAGTVNATQRSALLQAVDRQTTTDSLLIFVHGWHHNAEPGDENLEGFTSFLREMNCQKPPENWDTKCEDSNQYTGVYIGWRGDSANFLGIESGVADFWTLPDRKRTSVEVGEVGLKALLEDLDAGVASKKIRRFAVVGHSLGGSVVLHAVKDRLQRRDDNLYVMLNPAVTDAEYRPYSRFAGPAGSRFPKIVTLQAKNDLAIRLLFDFINVGSDSMGYSWALTHDLNSCDPEKSAGCANRLEERRKEMQIDGSCFTTLQGQSWIITARASNGPGRETCALSNQLLGWVILAKDGSVEAHNGILTSAQARALHALLEIKRTQAD